MAILELKGLTVRFGGLTAVNKLDLSVEQGSIHGLIGPNGAGKSTVFNVLSRYYDPAEGTVTFEGKDLLHAQTHDIVGRGIARTFQNVELFKGLSVWDNLMVGQHHNFRYGLLPSLLGTLLPSVKREEQEKRAKAVEVLDFLGITAYKDAYPQFLPYGIQKRVEFARALVSGPKLILLDEPAAGMNSSETHELGQLIRTMRDRYKTTVLLVEHDMSLVMSVCEQITVMEFGRKIADGTPLEIQNNPAVIKAYLGVEEEEAANA